MDAEMAAMAKYNCWSLVPLPPGAALVGSRWVFSIKPDGRYKARLVAQGFSQDAEEVGDTYAPVSKYATLRVFAAIAAAEDLEVQQFDISTAFLNSDLPETVYMRQPQGYAQGTLVCDLHKAIYGLKQSPRAWHRTLRSKLLAAGFVSSDADPSMFLLRHVDGRQVLSIIYVDDGLVAGRTHADVQAVMAVLQSCFECRLFGEPRSFLNLTIVRNRSARTLTISQEDYTQALLQDFGSHLRPGCSAVPWPTALRLRADSGEPMREDSQLYAQLIGSLMHLQVCTRPDIAVAVCTLSRYVRAPRQPHWEAALHVLRYLRGTPSSGITYGVAGPGTPQRAPLSAYTDADHGGSLDDRRSTSGTVVTLHGGAVVWRCKLQKTPALSTSEAEYQAAAQAARELLWLRTLMRELDLGADGRALAAGGVSVDTAPVEIYCDNTSVLSLLRNPQSTERSKHIDILHHFARDRVQSGQLVFLFCASKDNLADCMTKALSAPRLRTCLRGLGMCSV